MSVHRVWSCVETFDLYECACGQRFPAGEDLDEHVSLDRAELVEL